MDVSPPLGNPAGNSASYQQTICDQCGYSRHGLPTIAHCPECGEPPPRLADISASVSRPIEEQNWLRTLAIGLWLLVFSSVGALQVALVMPIAELSIGAINYPGPKLFATALVQRSIGGQPGPWGVYGCSCVMLSAVALFILTEPRVLQNRSESFWSLRRRTRWIGLLTLGGFSGFLISGFDPTISYHGGLSINLFVIGVVCCEMPANTLLYLFLRDLSKTIGDRRSISGFNLCVIAVPILCVLGVLPLAMGEWGMANFSTGWRLVIMVYGAAALAIGAAGATAVLRLAWAFTASGFGGWSSAFNRWPAVARSAMGKIDKHWPRWCVVIGLLVWIYTIPFGIQSSLSLPTRFGLGGNLPLLNFPGPKVCTSVFFCGSVREFDDDWYPRSFFAARYQAAVLTLLFIWLVTTRLPSLQEISRSRWAARFGVISLLAASFGAMLAITDPRSFGPSHYTAWAALTTEAPCTFLIYVYLSKLARSLAASGLADRLLLIARASPILILAPLPLFILSRRFHHWQNSWTIACLGAGYMAISVCVSLTALGCIAHLAWRLACEAMPSPAVSALIDPR